MALAKFKEQDSDLTSFEKFERELKSIVFGVLFVMLKDEEDSMVTQIVLTVADGIQTLGLTFNNNITFPWKNDTFVFYFELVLQFLQIAYWCMMLTWISYLVIFYIFIFIVCLVVIDIIYIGYSFSIKRFTIMWPLYILRSTCSLFVTVLFMPLIDLLTSMVQCMYADGRWYHYAFNDITCWQGSHIIHGTIALVVTGIFVIICTIVSMTFFESKDEPTDPSAKINARAEVAMNLYKIIAIIVTTFFIQDQYQWFVTVVLTAGALIATQIAFNERPYYNEVMNLVVDMTNYVYLWSCFLLCLAMLLADKEFSSAMQLFFLGTPIICIVVYTWRDKRKKLLMKPVEQFESGDEWYQKIRYYTSLIYYKDIDRAAATELKGFIYDHEETCDKKDCPLKMYKQNIANMIKDKKRKAGRNLGNENNNLLWNYANKLFQQGLGKFPSSTMMRIAYALFLKEKMNNKNMAISELFHAEKSSPPFDEQFVIYRYRKLMEEEMTEVQGEGNGGQSSNMDVVSIIAYDNHLRQCKEQIERAGYLHMEFWTELQQRKPDLAKLSKTGSRINTTIADVEEHWTRLQKINPNNPKALRMYGDFLIEILNDKEAGQELISRAKDNVASRTAAMPNFYDNANSGNNTADYWITTSGSDGSSCVLASGEQNKFGEVIQLNMGMCRTFGYTKNEILGKKIDLLMPHVYSKMHEATVKASMLKAEEGAQNDEKQGGGERSTTGRFILGRHKSGYMIPLILETRIFFLVSQGSIMGAMFKHEKKNNSVCYLLLDASQEVVGVSSLCITTLHITNSMIRNYRIPTSVLAPDLFDPIHSAQYRTKEGAILDLSIPETEKKDEKKESTTPRMSSSKDDKLSPTSRATGEREKEEEEKEDAEVEEVVKPKVRASKNAVKMNCHLTDIQFTGESKPSGYIVRLEDVEERRIELDGFKVPEVPKHPEFQIVFDPIKYRFLCAWAKEDAQREREVMLQRYKTLGILWKQTSTIKGTEGDGGQPGPEPEVTTGGEDEAALLKARNRQATFDFAIKERKNYGEGIKTKRLQNGEWVEVAQINKMIEREMEEQMRLDEEKRKTADKDLMSADAVRESLKSRKGLIAVIKDRSDPPSIVKLKVTGYVILLLFLAMAATEFGIAMTKFDDINDNVSMVRLSYRRVTLFMRIAFQLKTAIIANPASSSTEMITSGSYDAFVGDCKYDMNDALTELYSVQNQITLAKLSVNSGQSDLLNNKVVALYFKSTTTGSTTTTRKATYYTITEAVLQMASMVFSILSLSNSAFLSTNDDIDFVLYNVYKDLYDKVMLSSNYYASDLDDRAQSKQVMILIIFIVAIALLFVSIFVLFPLVSNVGKIRAKVLSLFLDIPLNDVKGLAKRCERFLASNNEDRNADVIDSSDSQGKDPLLEEEEAEAVTNGGQSQETRSERGSRRRRFINDKSSNMTFFIRYSAAILILSAFYIVNYIMTRMYLDKIDACAPELNATTVAQPLDASVLGMMHSLISSGSIPPLTSVETFSRLANVEIDRMQDVNHNIQSMHLSNKGKYPDGYIDTYQQIMVDNLCDSADMLGFTFDCSDYLAGVSREGLQTVMVQYVELTRELLRMYQTINSSSATSAVKSAQLQALLENSNDMYMEEADTIVNVIMEKCFEYLLDGLVSAYKQLLSSETTRRVVMFIVLLVMLIVGFFMMWAPFISRLSTEIWRTKCMLTIIPKEVIAQMKSVQKFLNDPNIFSAKGEA
ncbi:MAG: hypothetical protein P4L67_03890 [Candidatus Pacebacteria bacterium]|nr:hypothetical protein [Candidatus Paceibacterota bacterium]